MPDALENFRARLLTLGQSVAQAWFRHCDTERRGLSFPEFCQRLADLGGWLDGDVSELWSCLEDDGHLATLRRVDPESAQTLQALADFCRHRGGIFEVFLRVGPACGCVTRATLFKGLRRELEDEASAARLEQIFAEAWPLLDPWERGAICAQDFFCLETDCQKRRELDNHWAQALQKHTAGDLAQRSAVRNAEQNATQLLFKLAKESTWLGGKDWKSAKILEAPREQLPEQLRALRERRPERRPGEIRRSLRRPERLERLERLEDRAAQAAQAAQAEAAEAAAEAAQREARQRQRRSLYGVRSAPRLGKSELWQGNGAQGGAGAQQGGQQGGQQGVRGRDQRLFEHYEMV